MKISRTALLLAAIWGAMFLIPFVREIARVQIFGSALMRYSLVPHKRLPENFWAESALKYPRDLNIWIVAAQEYFINENEQYVLIFPGLDEAKPSVASPAFPGLTPATLEKETARRYDILIARFADHKDLTMLIARRLRFTTGWFSSNRIGGELGDWEWRPKSKTPAREARIEPDNFSKTELQAAIALCRRGQALAPDNAFFDWALCQFLLVARRDKEAHRALKSASQKKQWSEYFLQWQQAEIAARQTVWGRALIWEEKSRALRLVNSRSRFDYETRDILCWQSIKAKRRGDHGFALQLLGDMTRVFALRRRHAVMWGEVSLSTEQRAWDAASHDFRGGVSDRKLFPSGMREWWFQNYARKKGRPDLAREAASARQEFKALAAAKAEHFHGLSIRHLALLALWWRAGVALLCALTGATLALLVWEILARRWTRLKNTIQLALPEPAPSRRDVIGGVLGCWGVSVLLRALLPLGIAATWFIGTLLLTLPFPEMHESLLTSVRDAVREIPDYSFSNDSWINWLFYAYVDPVLDDVTRVLLLFAPLFLGFLHVVWRALSWQKNGGQNSPKNFSAAKLQKAITEGRWLHAGLEWNFARALQWLDERILFLGAGAAWWKRPQRRATLRYVFRLARASLMGFLVLTSALYLITLLASFPLRGQADARLNRIIEYGEVRASKMQ